MNPVAAIATLVTSIVSRIWPEAGEKEKAELSAQLQVALIESDLLKKQLDVNAVEAAHSNLFVAGWRPMIGWLGGSIMLWHYLLMPIITYVAVMSGHGVLPLPDFDLSYMQYVVATMLGVGAMRSFDKFKGTNTKMIK